FANHRCGYQIARGAGFRQTEPRGQAAGVRVSVEELLIEALNQSRAVLVARQQHACQLSRGRAVDEGTLDASPLGVRCTPVEDIAEDHVRKAAAAAGARLQ